MKLLLDTHTLLWVLGEPERLRIETRQILAEPANTVFVSAVSLWEIVVKCRVGKLRANSGTVCRAWRRPDRSPFWVFCRDTLWPSAVCRFTRGTVIRSIT